MFINKVSVLNYSTIEMVGLLKWTKNNIMTKNREIMSERILVWSIGGAHDNYYGHMDS